MLMIKLAKGKIFKVWIVLINHSMHEKSIKDNPNR